MKYTSAPCSKSGMLPTSQSHYFLVRNRHHPHQFNYLHDDSRTAIGIIAQLGSESNAHGLAKIVTSNDTKRKVIWALLVIVGFTAATLQLSLLVRKYLQFQVVELSEIKDSMPVEYPSVSVCNIEPISLRLIRRTYKKSVNLIKWLSFIQMFRFEQDSFMNSVRAFYENLGDEAKRMSHDLADMLIHCRFNKENCSVSNFTAFFDGNYFNCFTFNGGDFRHQLQMHATGPENGLSLIFSVEKDDPLPGTYGVYNFENNILHSAGIRVVVHAPGSMPSPVDHGFDIPPGYSSSVGLKAILHTRLPQPYGNCTNDPLSGIRQYRNTFFACLQLCKQRLIIQRCGCKSSALPEVPSNNASFCGHIRNWHQLFSNASGDTVPFMLIPTPQLACEEREQKNLNSDRTYETSCGCFQPCSETSYLKSVSLSYWPLEFYQLSALQKFFDQDKKTGQNHFMQTAHDYLFKLAQPRQTKLAKNDSHMDERILTKSYSLSEKEMAKEASDMIRQNMLRLNIYLEDLSVVEYRQLPAYGLADLFADVGGTLGLWMGISVLTIMELIELLIRLICLLFNSEKSTASSTVAHSSSGYGRDQSQQLPLANGHAADHDGSYTQPVSDAFFEFRRGLESPL